MQTVIIFRCECFSAKFPSQLGKFFSLVPWSGNTPDKTGRDDGGHEYYLPDVYKLNKEFDYFPVIFNSNLTICNLYYLNSNPFLWDPDIFDFIRLFRVLL